MSAHLVVNLLDRFLYFENHSNTGFHLRAQNDVMIQPGQGAYINSGATLEEVAHGYVAQIHPLFTQHRKENTTGSMKPAAIPVVLQALEEVIRVPVINYSSKPALIKRGEVIATLLAVKVGHEITFTKFYDDDPGGE